MLGNMKGLSANGDYPTTGQGLALFLGRELVPKKEGVSFSSISLGFHLERIHKMTKTD